jgi:peptidyl-prolyl cis-trans isomerase D
MLSFFRNLASTWPARIFFGALAAAFIGWGVSGKIGLGGPDPTAVATVGGVRIPSATFEQQYRGALQRVAQQYPDPTQIPPPLRQQVAQETLARLIAQQAIDNEARRLGMSAPDAAVQENIASTPDFQGLNGKFDHDKYVELLRENNLTPALFQELTRQDISKNQLLQAIVAGAAPSDMLTKLFYNYFNETRFADVVQIPFAGHAAPADPGDAVLRRYYDNNIKTYTAPEYRRIRAVILSPATIGRTLTISDTDLHAWYDAHKPDFSAPEQRSLQVITVGTEATAQTLAAQWRGGASWDDMQAAAKAAHATASTLDQTPQDGIPAPELAQAAFAAPLDTVTGPIKEPLGFQIVRVTVITPAKNPSFADLRDKAREAVGEERAADLIDARAQKLQDLFAGGNRIDEVPGDIGAAGVQGTLDAQGNTPDSTSAPIPATGDARSKIIADAFAAKKGETTQFTEGPNHVWYAVQVDDISPAAPRPFATVRASVLADWQTAQIHHDTESEAARLLATVKAGQTLTAAAWGTGRQVTRSAPVPRNRPPPDVPQQLAQILFTLKQGEPAMVQTPTGFIVATLAEVTHPDPAVDKSGMDTVRHGLAQALRDMLMNTYAGALMRDSHPIPNEKLVQQLTTGQGE